jgi:hypothetical protein
MNRTGTVLLASALLVGGANIGAYAASGRPLLLGTANHATSTTTLGVSARKPALALQTRKGVPPLKVGSSAVVKHLDADLLDGRSAGALGVRVHQYDIPQPDPATEQTIDFPDLKPGTYLVDYTVVVLGASGQQVSCWVMPPTGAAVAAGSGTISTLGFLGGSGLITQTADRPYHLFCDSSRTFTFEHSSSFAGSVRFVPVGSVKESAAETPAVG